MKVIPQLAFSCMKKYKYQALGNQDKQGEAHNLPDRASFLPKL